nr:MAG TPA: hypothetical protein [Caudoviricetes sp.]
MANRDLIKRGAILHSETFDFVDHGKFFVIMGVSHGEVAGFFFINSGINKWIQGKEEMLAMQYPMRKADYGFLRYDSFLAAQELLKIPISKIESDMDKGHTIFKALMKEEHVEEVLRMARHSKLFKPKDKKNFLG